MDYNRLIPSVAHLTAPYALKSDKEATVIQAENLLLEYEASASDGKFKAFRTAKPAKPVSRLVFFADRNDDGEFKQLWAGAAAHPSLWVPFPNLRYQFDIEGVGYDKEAGPGGTELKIGVVAYGGNAWTGRREFFAQLVKGSNSLMFYRTRATSLSPSDPGAIKTLGSRISLLGGTRKRCGCKSCNRS